MRKITLAVACGLVACCLNLCLSTAVDASDQVLNIKDAELWVRIVVSDTYNSSWGDEREQTDLQDRFNVTVEGTYKFKQYELPSVPGLPDIPGIPIPPMPSWPKVAPLVEDSRVFNIDGNGGGSSYHWWLWYDCDDAFSECKDFKQEGHQAWSYNTVDPVYDDKEVVRDLKITQQSEDDPVKYKFRLRVVAVGDYVKSSGTHSITTRNYTVNETSTTTIDQPASFSGGAWDDWLRKTHGDVTGELTFKGDEFEASGHITHNYDNTSGGVRKSGRVEIFYTFNPKPGARKIQPNQALGRYKYVDEQHYTPASDFVAGKDTVIQVFFDKAVPVDKLTGEISLEVSKDGSNAATLKDFDTDTENNALIFRPKDRSECGNWQAGTYKFTAKVKDAEETLDNVQFQNRRELKVLAVPVKTKFLGVVETPGNEWGKRLQVHAPNVPGGQ